MVKRFLHYLKKSRMRLLQSYFFVSGLIVHVALLSIFLHFKSTGVTPYYYVQKGISFLDQDTSPTRHVARVARLLLLDSGLVTDPIGEYPPDLTIDLPQWQGVGANVLRTPTLPRYTSQGVPVSTADRDLWALSQPPALRSIYVDSVDTLERELMRAQPGDEIVLKPGHYRISRPLQLRANGSAKKPLVLRGQKIGAAVIELHDEAPLVVEGSYWNLSDLIIRGNCGENPCAYVLEPGDQANGFTARNLFISGARAFIAPSSAPLPGSTGLLDGITLVGGRIAESALSWTQRAIRNIDIPQGPNNLVVVCTHQDAAPSCDTESLSDAVQRIAEGGLVLLRSGVYEQAATLRKHGLHLLAEPGATLRGKSTQGKGALVVDASVTIEGLECSHIKVGDGNGCCVRQQRGDLTLLGVHFHHSQMGILTGHNGGNIRIYDSYFHDSGYDESGQLGHNIYVNSGTLEFLRSWTLAARNAGHELKSRAERTFIEGSLIASLNARDSRLIDVPDGGMLEIRGSVLGEGPRSENWDLIGYGLELGDRGLKYGKNSISIKHNTIYVDRPQGANLLNEKHAASIGMADNVIIGHAAATPGNTHFGNREDAGAAAYPDLRPQTF
jgi:hypothetical protein